MLPRIAKAAVVVCFLCACTGDTTETSKSTDSVKVVTPGSSAAAPAPAAPAHRDTAIPASYVVTTPWEDTREAIDTSVSAPNFQCVPRSFTPNDTVTLWMVVPHGDALSVERPDGFSFKLVAPRVEGVANYSIVPSEAFSSMSIIRFRGDIRSQPFVAGHDTVETIFAQPGKYVFRVGNNLNSDVGRDVRDCTIRLVPVRN